MPRRARARPLWVLLMVAGAFASWSGGRIGQGGDSSAHDPAVILSDELAAGTRAAVGGAIGVAGGIVFALGLFALVRSLGGKRDPGAPIQTEALFGAAGLRPEDITPELLQAAGLSPDDLPPALRSPARAGPPPAPPVNPFDPTGWDHPAALLYVFSERPATAFYELVRDLRHRRLPTAPLLVALVQRLGPGQQKIVAVLGDDASVGAFERAFQEDVGAGVEAGELDWPRLRPDVQLQKESYDPRYTVDDPSRYLEVRAAFRGAGYMVLAADGG